MRGISDGVQRRAAAGSVLQWPFRSRSRFHGLREGNEKSQISRRDKLKEICGQELPEVETTCEARAGNPYRETVKRAQEIDAEGTLLGSHHSSGRNSKRRGSGLGSRSSLLDFLFSCSRVMWNGACIEGMSVRYVSFHRSDHGFFAVLS